MSEDGARIRDRDGFTANDLLQSARTDSYRQLNDWDARGVLSHTTGPTKSGWSRFTPREVFALMVVR